MTGRNQAVTTIAIGVTVLVSAAVVSQAQEPYFGKNKVHYRQFDWTYIESEHFDIYYYDDTYDLAVFAAEELERAYIEVARQLNHRLSKRVPTIIYQSHNDFQQTNVSPGIIDEGVGGFTESFKNRMVMPFTGSYEDFRHVLHHELTHAVTFDLLYGGSVGTRITGRLFQQPLWFAEGFAEYSSRRGWDTFADMVVRDATVNNYLIPLPYAGGFIVYKEGQSAINYLAEKYGEEKIAETLSKGKVELTMDNALKKTTGMGVMAFNDEWQQAMRKKYWPEISIRTEPEKFAKQLTDHTKDGSYLNERPAFSPQGDRLAIFTDKSDYTEVHIISAIDGTRIRRVVRGQSSAGFESLHSFSSGMDFSPDGRRLALIAKHKGEDALAIIDVEGDGQDIHRFGFQRMRSPTYAPDGKSVVFVGGRLDRNDLYRYWFGDDRLDRLTDDLYDEQDPSFSPDGRYVAFCGDRPLGTTPLLVDDPADDEPFAYGHLNIFAADLEERTVTNITRDGVQNKMPSFAPDGKRLCYVSDRNGIYNLYVYEIDTGRDFPVTNALSGCFSPDWSPDGTQLVFSAFYKAGFDIFLMKTIKPVLEEVADELPPTAFRLAQRETPEGEWPRLFADVIDFGENGPAQEEAMAVEDVAPLASGESSGDGPDSTDDESDELEHPTTGYVKKPGTGAEKIVFASDTASTTPEDAAAAEDSLMVRALGTDEDAAVAVTDTVAGDADRPRLPPPTGTGTGADAVDSTELAAAANGVRRDYVVKPYKLKFTPDLVSGGLAYDTFFGLRGQSVLLISDYLGDHQFLIASDLINTIDQANVQIYYTNARYRTNFGFGMFHSKYHYVDFTNRLFSDRTYGFSVFAARPFSKFTRLQLDGTMVFVDRHYLDPPIFESQPDDRNVRVSVATLSLVHDNIVWGMTGPVNGRRYKLSFEFAPQALSKGISYRALTADLRRYWRLSKRFSFAVRGSGGVSFGENDKIFFLGGVTNWIGSTISRNSNVFGTEGLYFSQVVTPMRGFDYYELAGTRYALVNAEFRVPFIDYLQMSFPLPISLQRVGGVLFYDMGAAWNDDTFFKGISTDGGTRFEDIKASFGWGMRANLGIVLLRFDQAFRTDWRTVAERPSYYFSLGADF